MHTALFHISNYAITGWHIVGFLGTTIFTLRWVIQMFVAIKTHESILTLGFWLMSALGSTLLLVYFIFGQPDIVGIVANLFPLCVAMFNIILTSRNKKRPVE